MRKLIFCGLLAALAAPAMADDSGLGRQEQ
jgi:hypothetical protein